MDLYVLDLSNPVLKIQPVDGSSFQFTTRGGIHLKKHIDMGFVLTGVWFIVFLDLLLRSSRFFEEMTRTSLQ
jgi:hypothetical protein